MLYLIGIGLNEKDISLKALEAIKKCKKIYLENYTSIVNKKIIERIIKKKVIPADRKFVEENEMFITEAKKENIALLVPGDPLSATTHVNIMLSAKKKKIRYEIIHAPSIFTAVAQTGLQLYKFGKTASIPAWKDSFKPESFFDIIEENEKINAHTLLLIDMGMKVENALSQLKEVAEKRNKKFPLLVVVCEAGTARQKIYKGNFSELMKKKFSLPACIILPSSLHFMEKEALDNAE